MKKILIGTPIHESKDYSMKRWLKNVAALQQITPVDLLLVDNSPHLEYLHTVDSYCQKFGVTNYSIIHLDFPKKGGMEAKMIRIEKSHELISQKIIDGNYDVWFSWECDQLIPNDCLPQLLNIMQASNTMMLIHNSWVRGTHDKDLADFGVALISRECLHRFTHLLKFVTRPDYPSMTDEEIVGHEAWFKNRVFDAGGNYVEVTGVISPIRHLKK